MRKFLLLIAALIGSNADAIQPESGWWWNAQESGRGFVMEVQNGTMFFAGYLYAQDGSSEWYVAQGPYNHPSSRFSGELLLFRGGQCMTCTYRPPTLSPSPGQVTVTFTSPVSGSLTWPGGTIPITRALYGTTTDVRRVLGSWVFSAAVSTLESGDWLTMASIQNTAQGTAAVGINLALRTSVALVDSSGNLGVLVDSSTSYYDLYIFPLQPAGVENLGDGRYWLYLKTGNPTGLGSPTRALKYGPGPASTNVEPVSEKKMADLTSALRTAMQGLEAEGSIGAVK